MPVLKLLSLFSCHSDGGNHGIYTFIVFYSSNQNECTPPAKMRIVRPIQHQAAHRAWQPIHVKITMVFNLSLNPTTPREHSRCGTRWPKFRQGEPTGLSSATQSTRSLTPHQPQPDSINPCPPAPHSPNPSLRRSSFFWRGARIIGGAAGQICEIGNMNLLPFEVTVSRHHYYLPLTCPPSVHP